MYENTNSSIDWKGLFLKVIIAFLIVLIAVTGYKTLKGEKNNSNKTTTQVVESNSSTTFTANMEKLKQAGETYFKNNKDKIPTDEGMNSMITLNELIKNGVITSLTDADGKACDGESSYVTAIKGEKDTTIKANLVCGDSYSYVTAYLGENDNQTETPKVEQTVTIQDNSSSKSNNTKTSNKQTDCSGCAANIDFDLKVSQTVTETPASKPQTNTNTTPSNNGTYIPRTYTVRFDEGRGNCYYNMKYVNEGNTVSYPGSCYKSGEDFVGWYLDNEEYNFNTPVTRDITLVAKYEDDDYRRNESTEYGTVTTLVYTMGWADRNINNITIDHTLSIDNAIEEIENLGIDENDVKRIKISDIEYIEAIDDVNLARKYHKYHADTFIYKSNGWESDDTERSSLATIKGNAVDFDYNDRFKKLSVAEDDGFDVTWSAYKIYKTCTSPFNVNGATNICNYGIVYQVTWEYEYYL